MAYLVEKCNNIASGKKFLNRFQWITIADGFQRASSKHSQDTEPEMNHRSLAITRGGKTIAERQDVKLFSDSVWRGGVNHHRAEAREMGATQ